MKFLMSEKKVTAVKITGREGLKYWEEKLRPKNAVEIIPVANKTPYTELAEIVMPDTNGGYVLPLLIITSRHKVSIGAMELCVKTKTFMESFGELSDATFLSISSGIEDKELRVTILLRLNKKNIASLPNLNQLYDYLGEKEEIKEEKSRLIIPKSAQIKRTEKDIIRHKELLEKQNNLVVTKDTPLLNQITEFIPEQLEEIDPTAEPIYDLLTTEKQASIKMPYEEFIEIFKRCMKYVTSVEKNTYISAVRNGKESKEEMMSVLKAYIKKNFIDTRYLAVEDFPYLLEKLKRALFELYVVQDLIDDPDITDIKITAYDSIRCRIKGKAYLSNVTFIDEDDYYRFVEAVAIRNGIDYSITQQTFTDKKDDRYILRFYITAPYITSDGVPNMEIRKINRKKLMDEQLLSLGVMDEKIRAYLVNKARYGKGVVFSGAPGSGKTVMLNWFLEQYESSAEILVIQENDELFSDRHGVMFEHIVLNPKEGQQACTLEELGKLALVAGANVFVIGEVKGAEIINALTLAASGCRTAMTIHARSATDTTDKMCDLVLQNNPNLNYTQARRMIKSFETIVYMEDFQVNEIVDIVDYDEERKDMRYRYIFRKKTE